MNNKFIKSTIILMIGGLITKILGFIIKIVTTRIIGQEGITLYSLIMPTYSLIIAIITFSLPLTISKIISENKYIEKDILLSSLSIILKIDIVTALILFVTKDLIATNLLNEPTIKYLIIAIIITIPFISISSIYKGYFLGKQNPYPNCVSNIFEQLLKIIIIITIFPFLIKINVTVAIIGIILLNVFQETLSIFIFKIYLKKHSLSKGTKKKNIQKEIISISTPNVLGRLIGNIGYFFEPIILTKLSIKSGIKMSIIKNQYGSYNAYAIALLTMPSFFISAISSALLPEISKYHILGKKEIIKKRLMDAIRISLFIGIFFTSIILIFREKLLLLLYKNTSGAEYIKILAPFFILFYLEAPLSVTLQGINKIKETFKITTYGVILKTIILIIFSIQKKGILSLIYAEIINIFFVTIYSFILLNKYFKEENSF